ncbi:MAG: hypothetical protein M1834_000366 [Cirrosporium novae-zelandiae]|nr:MAG: hypothetical protein M1834_000366 [Cirrosporium novae-zelandiae]
MPGKRLQKLHEERLRVLLVGNGGREHALAWKLSQSPIVQSIAIVPGNGGTSEVPKATNVSSVKADDFDAGINCFGPSKEAALLEGSKTYAKDFMRKYQIPTAQYQNFNDYESARVYIDTVDHDIVIKASGLAAGKGVLIPTSKEEAHQSLKEIMLDKQFGDAGNEIVIEEFLTGDELSILSFSDGYTIRSLPPAQDHKRVGDNDTGLNTGGMGAYAPTPLVTKATIAQIHREILQPTIDGMRREGYPFRGILFTGFMMTKTGPKVLEYNVRFGDPETQTVLPLLNTDLAQLMVASTEGWLDTLDIKTEDKFVTTVVAAAGGYPGPYAKGIVINIKGKKENSLVFHAGTSRQDGTLRTSGGRVLASTAIGSTLKEAVSNAYAGMSNIKFENMHYRHDIAHRAFEHASKPVSMTYAEAGVSVDDGNLLVEQIKPIVRSTKRPGADTELGGFGGTFDLKAAGHGDESVLVACCDGVGTKLEIAREINEHSTIGIDLVAMSANDLIVQGAEPLLFLDIFSCSKLDVTVAKSVIQGIAEGCKQAECALVGGETAEMPGMFEGGSYDVGGFAIGAVKRKNILPQMSSMKSGDVLLGIASTGIHSNGFSLVRRIITAKGLTYKSPAPWDESTTIGLSLLTPTRIYQSLVKISAKETITGLSHITGGGFVENVPRMLPKYLAAEIDVSSWFVPPVFKWLKRAGNIAPMEMARTFNNGIGMVVTVPEHEAEKIMTEIEAIGEKVFKIGRLVERTDQACILKGLEAWN